MVNCEVNERIVLPYTDCGYEYEYELGAFEFVDTIKSQLKETGGNEVLCFFKFQDVSDRQSYIWINEHTLRLGQALNSFMMSTHKGVYSEKTLIEMGILEKNEECFIDFNDLPELTQKEIDDFEPERLRLEQEIREYEEQQKEKEKELKKSGVVSLLEEKKMRCKKDKS